MSHESYTIPEGGVCGAFNTEEQVGRAKKMAENTETLQRSMNINWNDVPEDIWAKVSEIVEDINDSSYVPTQVLKDTLDKIRRRHHGDEPTTEEGSDVVLIEKELSERGDDSSYGS